MSPAPYGRSRTRPIEALSTLGPCSVLLWDDFDAQIGSQIRDESQRLRFEDVSHVDVARQIDNQLHAAACRCYLGKEATMHSQAIDESSQACEGTAATLFFCHVTPHCLAANATEFRGN